MSISGFHYSLTSSGAVTMMGLDKRLLSGTTRHWLGIAVLAGSINIALTVALFTLLGVLLDNLLQGHAAFANLWHWLAGVVFFKLLFGWLEKFAAFRTSAETKMTVRDRIYEHALRLGPGVLGKKRTGELVNLAVEGMEWLETLYGVYWAQFIIGMITPLLLVGYIMTIDWVVGLTLVISIPLTPAFLMLVQRRFKSVTDRYFAAEGRLSAQFLDSLQGLPTLKMLNLGKVRGEQLREESERLRQETMHLLAVNQLALFLVDWGFALGTTVAVTGVAFLRIGVEAVTYGAGITLVLLSLVATRPLNLIGKFFFAGAIGRSAAKQAGAFLDEQPEVAEQEDAPEEAEIEPHAQFENVTFSYSRDGAPVLRNLSLEIAPGETVALIGPSGAGKTTVINLLLRFVEPDQGQIRLGARPIEEYSLQSLRQSMALVSQNPYLFHGTIRENLQVANPDASPENMKNAARAARIHEFIMSLPEGYETIIGERGTTLSGGQAQRLALVRALLKDAPLIILDEPTSQIDTENEALIQEALEHLMRAKTVFIISHRLSTVREADRILIMKGGRIVEQGDHESLMEREGIYARIVNGRIQQAREVVQG